MSSYIQSRQQAARSLCIYVLAGAIISGCAGGSDKAEPMVRGKIASINGEVRRVAPEEEDAVCKENFCEPNIVYTADFARPRPTPTSSPTPTPTASPTPPVATGDKFDYSKTIMNVQTAWAITKGGAEPVVAVVDSGADVDHPDLIANLVQGYDFYNGDSNPDDDGGHGTHVSGTIAAGLNGFGAAGVAPNSKLMPLKFLGASGSGDTADAISAINYAVDNGAKVISNSWGSSGYSSLLNSAIQRAISRGVIVVAAAGNKSQNNDSSPYYPASYTGVLTVASTDSSDNMSSFSSYGVNSVEIAASGSNIYNTYLNGGYATLSGTSMATPQVSGALALALGIKPSLTAQEITDTLCSTARKIHLTKVKCGRMDVGAFVTAISQM